MALSKMGNFSFNHSDQQDALYKVESATEIKAAFDSRAEELKTALSNVIDALESVVEGDSGAKTIGVETIPDVSGNDVQSVLKSFRDILKSVTDGSSGADFIGSTAISGVSGTTIQAQLESVKALIDDMYNLLQLGNTQDGNSGADKIGATPIETSPSTVQGLIEYVWNRINNLIINNGQSDAEIIDARDNGQGTIFPTLRDRLNDADEQLADIAIDIKNKGAIGDGVTDDSSVIQSTIDSLPESGGTLLVPDGTYLINTDIDFNGKTINFMMGPNVKFTGTGKMPSNLTNAYHSITQHYILTKPTGGEANKGNATITAEIAPDESYVGNAVSGYFGVLAKGSGGAWALNPIVRADTGFTGHLIGNEIDVDILAGADPSDVSGLLIDGIGDFTNSNNRGLFITRADGSKWDTGIFLLQAKNGITIEDAESIGILIRKQNKNAIVIIPEDDIEPESNMIYGTDPNNIEVRWAITKDGGALLRRLLITPSIERADDSFVWYATDVTKLNILYGAKKNGDIFFSTLRIGAQDSSKITYYKSTVPNISVPLIPPHSSIDLSINVGMTVDKFCSINANPINVPDGVLWSINTENGNVQIRFANITDSDVQAFNCDCNIEIKKH